VYLRPLKLHYTQSKKDETKFWSRNSEKENIYFFNNRNYDFITGAIYGTGNADSEIPRSGQHQGLKCKSINRDINVRRRTSNQQFTWTTETIHVGCTAVFDCVSC
jgi:hypothetical protein